MHNMLSIRTILILNNELSEKNERIATELNNTLNQLQNQIETSSITDKSQINQIVETINAILEEAISVDFLVYSALNVFTFPI
jgi:hypothetical protein